MKFTTNRESMLRPIQLINGVVERRQTLPVLSNLLVEVDDKRVSLTGTDLEVELVASVSDGVEIEAAGRLTLPARKLADIWRALPDGAPIVVEASNSRCTVRSGRSRFALATLPAADFPRIESAPGNVEVTLSRGEVQRLLDQTAFAMAQQDVRYFLNGMLLEITTKHVRTVATDGHRLAMCTLDRSLQGVERASAIIPRKGVLELLRLVSGGDAGVVLSVARNYLRATSGSYVLTSKLVDGRYPDYEKVIPKASANTVLANRDMLRDSLARASILSNEKYRGIRMILEPNQLTIEANNPDQEEAEERVPVEYSGQRLEIGFNVGYLQDVLAALSADSVSISVSDANSSALLQGVGVDDAAYVVMPMRL